MSIEVICPSCQKVHQVKDDAAGKKLRCKGCQAIVPIPALVEALDDADPWEDVDENEGGDELPPIVRQAAPVKKKSVRRERASSGDGMPVTVIASLCINGLFSLYAGYNFVDSVRGGFISGRTAWAMIRLACDVTVVIGLIKKNNRIRWNGIVLNGLGLAFIFLCVGPLVLLARDQVEEQLDDDVQLNIELVLFGIQGVLWLADLILLLTPSARSHCSE